MRQVHVESRIKIHLPQHISSFATFPSQHRPNIKLTLFDLDRDITLKPLLREMSSFKKILISTEMSGKMEVIVPEKPGRQ